MVCWYLLTPDGRLISGASAHGKMGFCILGRRPHESLRDAVAPQRTRQPSSITNRKISRITAQSPAKALATMGNCASRKSQDVRDVRTRQ